MKSVPMFRNWAKSRLTRLCGLVRRVDFKAGALIIKQNDPPDNVYFVLEGAVAVVKTIEIRTFNRWPSGKDGGHETVARCAHKLVPLVELGPGSCFGERGILYGELRKATVTAATDVTLLAVAQREVLRDEGILDLLPAVRRLEPAGPAERVLELRELLHGRHVRALQREPARGQRDAVLDVGPVRGLVAAVQQVPALPALRAAHRPKDSYSVNCSPVAVRRQPAMS